MGWLDAAGRWLLDGAAGSFIVLTLGALGAALCRQPVRRIRLILCTLAGALIVPALVALSVAPRWSIGLLPGATVERTQAAPMRPVPTPEMVRVASSAAAPPAPAPPNPSADAAPTPARPWRRPDARTVALAAYALGSVALGAWWGVGQARLRWVVRGARPATDRVRARFLAISGPAGGRVTLLESDRVALPFTYTGIRPVIVLPATSDDDSALDYGLAHEWSHVENGDARAWGLATLAGLVLHPQPAYWWLRGQLRLCQDYLADDRAAAAGSAVDYASYLVRLARARLGGPALPALGIGGRRSNLTRRVVMLLNEANPLEHRCRAGWTATVAALTAALVVLSAGVRLNAAPDPQDGAKPPPAAPAPKAAGDRTWTGRVLDQETRKPIAGAKVLVRLSLSGPDNRDRVDHRLTTDAEGRFTFTVTAAQAAEPRLFVWLEVDAADHVPEYGGYGYGMILKNEQLGERPFFETTELPPGKTVTGRVATPDGRPAGGIKVSAFSTPNDKNPLEGGQFVEDWTDDDGRFSLTVHPKGKAVLWVIPESYNLITRGLDEASRGTDLGTFTLAEGLTIKGKLVDAQGKPVGGVFVGASGTSPPATESPVPMGVADMNQRAVVTADDGTFALGPFAPGTYRVAPTPRGWNPSTRVGVDDPADRPLPAVFTPQSVTLTAGQAPEALTFRAVPHVVVSARMVDSQGKPRRGHEITVFGRVGGEWWNTEARCNDAGEYTAIAPRGLISTYIQLMTNEHSSLAFRMAEEQPLKYGRIIDLGTLAGDVRGIEIVRFVAPILLVKAVAKDGRPVKEFRSAVVYTARQPDEGGFLLDGDVRTDVSLEKQNDGRYRTSQLAPGREVEVSAWADGLKRASQKVTLAEGQTQEIELVLEP